MTTTNNNLGDQLSRDRISDNLDETLFVNAGAGSGKTTALVKRIVNLILEGPKGQRPVPILEIAAITFTEMAGADLRFKLRKSLQDVIDGGDDLDQVKLAQAALDDLDGAAIGTIHSFARRILAEHGMAIGIPPAIEIVDAIGESVAYDENWPAMRDALLDDKQAWAELERALDFGLRLDEVKALGKVLNANWDLIDKLIQKPPASANKIGSLARLLNLESVLFANEPKCTDQTDKWYFKLLELHGLVDDLQAATTDTQKIDILRKIRDFGVGQGGTAKNWDGVAVANMKTDAKAIASEAANLVAAADTNALAPIVYRVGQLVLADVNKRRENGQLQFNDQIILARNLVTQSPEVRAELQAQYRHIFLDEFQDTDPLQIELAMRIAGGVGASAANWANILVPDGSLFLVGDAKQSIYKFRRANIATYLAAEKHFLNETLTTNFRTIAPILKWVNGVMESIITQNADSQPEYVPLVAARNNPNPEAGPAVTIIGAPGTIENPVDANNNKLPKVKADELKEMEAADAVAVICEALSTPWLVSYMVEEEDENREKIKVEHWRPIELKDIVILVPARTTVPFLTAALEKAKIPYQADAASNPFRDLTIVDLHRAVRALAQTKINGSFHLVHALRTRLFGCSDADLVKWVLAGNKFRLPKKGKEYPAGNPVADGLNYLAQLKRKIQKKSLTPAQVLETLIADRQLVEIAAYDAATRATTWRRLRLITDLARAWRRSTKGTGNAIESLDRYIFWVDGQMDEEAKTPEVVLPDLDLDAVRIMTIHNAKGLEFPMVLLTGLTSTKSATRYPEVILNYAEKQFAIKLQSEFFTENFDTWTAADDMREKDENARKLYVGATRAKDHLVVSTHRFLPPVNAKTGQPDLSKVKDTLAQKFADARASLGNDEAKEFPGVKPQDLGTGLLVNPRQIPVPAVTLPTYDVAQQRFKTAQEHSQRLPVINPSSLKNTSIAPFEPTGIAIDDEDGVVLVDAPVVSGSSKTPVFDKGRRAGAIGSLVHKVLEVLMAQHAPAVAQGTVPPELVKQLASHHASEFKLGQKPIKRAVIPYVERALASATVRGAAMALRRWPEVWVGTAVADDVTSSGLYEPQAVTEGIIDLLYQNDDGSFEIVDYKTDTVDPADPAAALKKLEYAYAPQLQAYARALTAITGKPANATLLFLDPTPAVSRPVLQEKTGY